MKTKIKIKSIFGNLLFEFEKENNTIKDTLEEAIKCNANLEYANLESANLESANIESANLKYANLKYANLESANLESANLESANLEYANLKFANLESANLKYANLEYVNLESANLEYTNLKYVNLDKKTINKIKHTIQIIPEDGSFIAWKKLYNECLAKIEIPARAKRVCNFKNRKCRASYVKTLVIWDKNGKKIKEQYGYRDSNTIYKVNRITRPDKFDSNPLKDCTNGIHFFVTKREALDW